MLNGAGFDGIDINPKMYDLVMYFIAGMTTTVADGLKVSSELDWFELFWSGAQLTLAIIAFVFVMSFTFQVVEIIERLFSKGVGNEAEETTSISSFVNTIVENATKKVRGAVAAVVSLTVLSFMTLLGSVGIFILGNFILALMLIATFEGYEKGIQRGTEYIAKSACIDRDVNQDEIETGFAFDCPELKIDGEFAKGIRIYSDKNSTFFMTNENVIQVDSSGRSVYERAIERF